MALKYDTGKINSNKTKGSGHKKKSQPLVINPREEWGIVENCHAAVKTEEEHMKLLAMLEKNKGRDICPVWPSVLWEMKENDAL